MDQLNGREHSATRRRPIDMLAEEVAVVDLRFSFELDRVGL